MKKRARRARRPMALDEALADAGDGAVAMDTGGRILAWNRTAEQILEYSAKDVVGRTCCEVFDGRDTDGNRLCHDGCRVMTLLAMREPVRPFDMRSRTKAGRPVWLNVSALATRRAGRRQIVHLFRDVTAARELLTLVQERRPRAPEAPPGPAPALSPREREVLQCLADGLGTAAAAARLVVSRATVRNHVASLLAKLGVHSRLHAVSVARQHRLV